MRLVTFSGLDGCGKSTHVSATVDYFTRNGVRARPLLTVWLSATGLRRWLRGILGNAAAPRARRTRPSPHGKVREHGERRSYREERARTVVRLQRWLVYPFDAIVLRAALAWMAVRGFGAVVCDRYTFDKLANLPQVDCVLSRVVRWLAPNPDLAVFLDVGPEEARSRRDEHDASYYETKYACYRTMVDLGWGLEPFESSTIESIQRRIEQRLRDLT